MALKGRTYDVIVSNPSYMNAESLAKAKSHFKPGGLLVVEIRHNCEVLEAAYPALPFT